VDTVEPLFPIPLLRSAGLVPADLIAALTAAIEGATTAQNLRSAALFHTDVADPRGDPLFSRLTALVTPKLVDFGALLFGERLEWTVKEMWTNVLEPGGNQVMHSHANSFVSGVLYLTDSDPRCRTVFIRPPGGFDYSFRHHTRTAQMGPYNAGKYLLPEANPGDLVLFPSYLYHEVPVNPGGRRLTVAFNAMPHELDCWGYRIRFSP
jgi:uncharacterized protein (TIGR02466 family)